MKKGVILMVDCVMHRVEVVDHDRMGRDLVSNSPWMKAITAIPWPKTHRNRKHPDPLELTDIARKHGASMVRIQWQEKIGQQTVFCRKEWPTWTPWGIDLTRPGSCGKNTT